MTVFGIIDEVGRFFCQMYLDNMEDLKKHINVREKDVKRAAKELKYEPELMAKQQPVDLDAGKPSRLQRKVVEIAKQQEIPFQMETPIDRKTVFWLETV